MNPTVNHNSEFKDPTYSLVPSTVISSTSGQERPPSYSCSSSGIRFRDTTASFTPLVTVDTTGGIDFPDYFSPTASTAASSFHAPSTFNSHHPVQSTYASLITENDIYSSRQLAQPHLSYVNSTGAAPSLQRFIGGLTSKLPDLQCSTSGNMDVAYSAPHMVGLASSPHASLISPAYSPSSVTTQGSGGGGSCKRTILDVDTKPGAFKSRSKKESHNRIERRRRDYINSQITRLGGLLPAVMYRDVDGRRNKGTVLRLSVNYILELRQAVAHTASLRQETAIARQLIPLLLSQIQSLESVIKDVEMSTGKPLGGCDQEASGLLQEEGMLAPEGAAYEAVLEAWRTTMTANLTRAALSNNNGESSQESKIEAVEMPLMENMQVTYVRGPPTTTANPAGPVASPYLPNAVFMGVPVCKLEEDEEICYGGGVRSDMTSGGGNSSGHMVVGGHVGHNLEDTTDCFFDASNSNNNNSNGSTSKFDLSIMHLASTGATDCRDSMHVECENH